MYKFFFENFFHFFNPCLYMKFTSRLAGTLFVNIKYFMMGLLIMDIVQMRINDLKPYDKNPRKNDGAVDYVAESIKEFGFKVPIVIDKNNVIVAGHTRYKASKKLGFKEVPCIVADDLNEEQIKAFRLADNKVGEFAEWDFDLLNSELDDLIDIDMELFGFNATSDLMLDVNDEDFLQDTEITKEKKAKKIVCPHCGEEIEV